MKKIWFGLIIVSTFFIYSFDNPKNQNDITTFVKTFGGSDKDYSSYIQQTLDGGYIISGSISSFGNGSSDFWLIKTDSDGNEIWNQTFGRKFRDVCSSVDITVDGGYIITGQTWIKDRSPDVWVIKTDSNGIEEWNKTFGGKRLGDSKFIQQTSDSGFIIIGSTYSLLKGMDLWLIKSDSQGNEEWNKTFNESRGDIGNCVQQTTDGGYILSGVTNYSRDNVEDVWLIKTDSNGNEEWNKIFGGMDSEWGNFVQQTTDGGYIIVGFTRSFGNRNGRSDIWLIKTDSQGVEEWNKTYGGDEEDSGHSVQQTTDGGYIITGATSSFGNGDFDVFLIKTNSVGVEEWNKTFGGSEDDEGISVQQTTDGGFIITGITRSYGNGDFDVLLIKTDPLGNTSPY